MNGMLLIELIHILFEVLRSEEFINHSFVYSLCEVIKEVLLVECLHLGEDLGAERVEVGLASLRSFFWLDLGQYVLLNAGTEVIFGVLEVAGVQ